MKLSKFELLGSLSGIPRRGWTWKNLKDLVDSLWRDPATLTDELVKYDAADPTAGYLADKIIGSANISVAEGTGADENKLKIAVTGLATVATSGSYNDLENKPTIPAAQIQSDWAQATNTEPDYIKNKPASLPVLTDFSVDGDGSAITPIVLVNDADAPGNSKYYGTNIDGTKGWHLLPFAGDNVYVVYNETELLAAYASAISYVGKSATIYIGAKITFTANRSFIRAVTDASITFYGIGVIQVFEVLNTVLKCNYVTFRNIGFTTTSSVYVTVEGHYASFYNCRWWSEVLYSATFSQMKIAVNCIGAIASGTGQIILDGVYHASMSDTAVNNGDIQPFIIQNTASWNSVQSLYVNIIRFEALKDFDRFSKVLMVATANAAYKVTGDLTWYFHADQVWPGNGFILAAAVLLKKGSVDDLRGDFIPSGAIVKVLGVDTNNKIRQDTIPVPVPATGAELNTGTNNTKFATAQALKDGEFIGVHVGASPPADTTLLWLDTN